MPIEFSFLFRKVIEKDVNKIDVKVPGGRELENGLVVPVTYFVWKGLETCEDLFDEAKKRHRGMAAHEYNEGFGREDIF